MKFNKQIIYPLTVLIFLIVTILSISYGMRELGYRINPSQEKKTLVKEEGLAGLSVIYESGNWKGAFGGPYEPFSSDVKDINTFVGLKELAQTKHGFINEESILLFIKHSADKKKLKLLLEHLGLFSFRKIFVISPFADTLKNLKVVEPRLLFSLGPKSWMKWSLYSSFFLEMMMPVDVDFLFISEKSKLLLTDRLKNEIKRRGLFLLESTKVK